MKDKKEPGSATNISASSFITAIIVIFSLMVVTYMLTFLIPGGQYARVINESGESIVDTETPFKYVEGGISFHKWILSPFLVLGAEGGGTIIAVIAFLLIVGGVFNNLTECGLMSYMLDKIVRKYGNGRYKLMAIVTFFFMGMGSFIGSFEECVPLVPIVVALSLRLGWDALTGMGMSLLAAGCGFAAGICNPFTVGVAQKLAGLPMFSGLWFRCVSFGLIYIFLMLFLFSHSNKIQKPVENIVLTDGREENPLMDRALVAFACILGTGILLVLLSGVIPVLQDYTMIIVAVVFLIAGVVSMAILRIGFPKATKNFGRGVVSILPAILLILMASAIKFILVESKILDTLLYYFVHAAEYLPGWAVVLFIYVIVLILNFFVSSGSAKAFLLMPLIVPMAQIFNISPQLSVMAFAFGDGFTNTISPTNPVLLISLGLAGVSYGKWARFTWKFQLAIFILTSLLLVMGYYIGYS